MSTMRVVAIRAFGGEEVLVDEVWPTPEPSAGQVRVRVEAASINPIDLYWRGGRVSDRLPVVLGRDFAGVVDALGEGVDDLRIQDAVFGYHASLGSNGSYAEQLCLPSKLVARRPATWTAAECAALPVAGLTAYKAVREKARLRPGAPVLVAGGAGGVGAMIVRLAKLAGADPILATAGIERSTAALVDGLGLRPEWILDYRGVSLETLAERVRALSGGYGVAAAFDTVGGEMKRLCFKAAAADGDVVSIVEEPADYPLNLWDDETSPMSQRSLSFHFVQLGAAAQSGNPAALGAYRRALSWLTERADEGGLKPPVVKIVGSLCANAAREAHALLATRHTGAKLVLAVTAD